MTARQEAIDLFLYLEKRGIKASARSIGIALRAHKIAFRDADLRAWLDPFTKRRDAARPVAAESGPHESRTRAESGTERAEGGPRLRAHDKVSLATNLEATPPALPLGIAPSPPAPPSRPVVPAKPARVDPRTPAEKTADDAIVQMRDVIEPALNGMTWTTWRSRNRKAVVDMARSGMTADEIVEAHAEASEARGGVAMVMAWVQERVVRQAASPVSSQQSEIDNLPTVANGGIAGTPPDMIPPWQRPPNHPRHIPWSAEFEKRWKAEHPEPSYA